MHYFYYDLSGFADKGGRQDGEPENANMYKAKYQHDGLRRNRLHRLYGDAARVRGGQVRSSRSRYPPRCWRITANSSR